MKSSMTYTVIEDNAGGLHLFVFEDDAVIYEHSGYEHTIGQLQEDLAALHQGGHPSSWDGCEEDPQGDWDHMMSHEYGYTVVAEWTMERGAEIYIDQMGSAALLEFDHYIDEEE